MVLFFMYPFFPGGPVTKKTRYTCSDHSERWYNTCTYTSKCRNNFPTSTSTSKFNFNFNFKFRHVTGLENVACVYSLRSDRRDLSLYAMHSCVRQTSSWSFTLQLEVEISTWSSTPKFIPTLWGTCAPRILPISLVRTSVTRFFRSWTPGKKGYIKKDTTTYALFLAGKWILQYNQPSLRSVLRSYTPHYLATFFILSQERSATITPPKFWWKCYRMEQSC